MRNGTRAVLLDLDGTLLDGGGRVTDRTRETIRSLIDSGLEIFLVTGRSIGGAVEHHEALGLETPLVCYNGAVIYDPAREDWLEHRSLREELVDSVLEFALDRADLTLVFHEDTKYSWAKDASGPRRLMTALDEVRGVDSPEDLPTRNVTKVSFATCEEGTRAFFERHENEIPDRLYVESFDLRIIPSFRDLPYMICDVHAASDGKGEIFPFLKRAYGIEASETLAVGDHKNDLPMLTQAGFSVAVDNAHDEVKAVADRIIGHHTSEGVATFLEEFFQ